ncbi:MAG: 2,3-bisphosphoglycerate-independent phosphoglycerate mutase [Albidovulum sp.]|nr:2,3-bisphosphoglycerate-independent phosphoglycerate mutase [Albidovulum sp.]
MKNLVALCILDGWGLRSETFGNAVALANTPAYSRLVENNPCASLTTSGRSVGLQEGQMGNSEVGHLHIGAGRTVWMDIVRIDMALSNGSFFQMPALNKFCARLAKSGGKAHLIGLMSDGGVHGVARHIAAVASHFERAAVPAAVHAITDGRDTPPRSAIRYLKALECQLPASIPIATVCGRYFAMDRDRRWERVEKAWQALVRGNGHIASSAERAILDSYDNGIDDEFVAPTVVSGFPGISENDGIFMLNFRTDRARQLASSLVDPGFAEFDVSFRPRLSAALGMVDYFGAPREWMDSVFEKQRVSNTLGSWVSRHGYSQFRLAETEKYPHVTYFLNGGKEEPYEGEDRFMAQSPKVATYDLAPEMAAREVSQKFVEAIARGYDLVVANFANPDMVGHTGDLGAAVKACEAVDRGLDLVLGAMKKVKGTIIVTADHGNCEQMIDPETGAPHTAHTTHPVPVAIAGAESGIRVRDGKLTDLAPTILELMGIDRPPEMTGRSLISN